jgi:SAM-dependent methyltransferase
MPEIGEIYNDGSYLRVNSTWHEEDSPYKSRLVSQAISRNHLKFETCADVGCGSGLVTELVAQKFPRAKCDGFDLSADAAEFWKRRPSRENLSYKREDFVQTGGMYDLVLCLDVFEHVEDFFGFLKLLRQKGRNFIFNVPLDMCVAKLLSPGLRYAREESGHLHYFNKYTALCSLRDCGYKITDSFIGTTFLNPPRSIKQAIVMPIRVSSLLLGKNLSSLLFGGASLVVTARSE